MLRVHTLKATVRNFKVYVTDVTWLESTSVKIMRRNGSLNNTVVTL